MKRKLLSILGITLLLLLALAGCCSAPPKITQYNTAHYSIAVKDGQYLLTPINTLFSINSRSSINASQHLLYPKFSSVSEMRQGIITGSYMEEPLAEAYMYALTSSSEVSTGTIEICNLDKLYECTTPSDMDTLNIVWYGGSYLFNLSGETTLAGIHCCDQEEYIANFNEGYMDFLSNPKVVVTNQEAIEERSATVYYSTTSIAEMKDICYEIIDGDKHIFIQETYLLESNHDLLEESSATPLSIKLWGTENAGYFYGSIHNLSERPSVEWLSQFGIREYVETSTS